MVHIVRVEAKQQFLSEIPYVGAIVSLVSSLNLFSKLSGPPPTTLKNFGTPHFLLHPPPPPSPLIRT